MRKTIANYLDSKAIYLFWAAVCLCVYAPSLGNDFLTGWDDQWMVFSRYTEAGWTMDNLWHIFTDFFGGQYAPIAFFGYMALHSLFGYDPFYFHLYSVLLHIGCVCLVWRFIQTILRMHGGMAKNDILFVAFVTTILFAVHPHKTCGLAVIHRNKQPRHLGQRLHDKRFETHDILFEKERMTRTYGIPPQGRQRRHKRLRTLRAPNFSNNLSHNLK